MAVLSVVIQVQTQLVPMNLPHLLIEMSDLKPFPKMTLTMNICAHIAGWSIRLVMLIYKIHRFLFSYADIDFAESASIIWGGGQDCPINNCEGKNHGKFQLDEELIRRIIVKSCFEKDRQSTNNGVITDDVAGSSRRNQSSSLTSG
jgi:hypothetical protein